MSLSELLQLARGQAEKLKDTALPSEYPAWVLFFSIANGSERASVHIATGSSFEKAWLSGAQTLQQWKKKQKKQPEWLRVDIVDRVEALSWQVLQDKLQQTKRNYFRFGLAFDPQFSHAILEQEIGAGALLYDGKIGVATPNAINLNNYAKRRFGEPLDWPERAEQSIWRFTTRAVFTDGSRAWRIEHQGRNAGYRQITHWPAEHVATVIDSATDYLSRQIKLSGEYYYGWFPCFDRPIPSYNALRHASSTYALLEGWELTQDNSHKAAIDRTLRYLTQQLIHSQQLADGTEADFLVDVGDEIKLGGNAVSILALAKYTELTGDQQYVAQMERLANGIAYMQDRLSGAFVHVLNYPDLSVKEAQRIIYYDGEAAFALIRLYAITKNERWLQIVERAFDNFIAQKHWRAHDHWLSYCVNELTMYRLEARYYQFGLDNVREHLDFVLERITTYPTLLELMMAAQRMIARLLVDPQHRYLLDDFDLNKFGRALEYRARYLLNGFFWPELAMFFKNPQRIVGSFFIRHHSYRVRIDDVEHYLSGYVAYLKYLNNQQIMKLSSPVREESRQQVVFLCADIRNVGNGIEAATLSRARLFARQMDIAPWIVTSEWNPALADNVEMLKKAGKLPSRVQVFNIYHWLISMRDRGEIGFLPDNPQRVISGMPQSGLGGIKMITYTLQDPDGEQRCHEFLDDQHRVLLRKCYREYPGKSTLIGIEINDHRYGIMTFSHQAGFNAAMLEANLDCATEWHFIVDKNQPWSEFVNSRPQQRFHATVTALIHSSHRLPNGERKGTYRHILEQHQRVDQLVVLTEEQRQDLIGEGFPEHKLRVIPHPAEARYSTDTLDKIPSKQVLYMARYSPEKQHGLLIRAFERVVDAIPDAQLQTYGTGPLRAALRKQVMQKGLDSHIHINGFSDDVAEIQRRSCCAVLCSNQEGFSLFGLESLAHGTPLVSFAIKYGPRDLLHEYDAGVLVTEGDERALADALIAIINDPGKQKHMQQQALCSAGRFYSELIAEKWQRWWLDMRQFDHVNRQYDEPVIAVSGITYRQE
nr:glycosyltransferase [Pantoea sp. 201603H]